MFWKEGERKREKNEKKRRKKVREKKRRERKKKSEEKKREELYSRINLRVDKMIENGLYYEWERMTKKHGRTKVLENTIGYKEFFELENGIYSNIDEAIIKIKQRTRNFAKRQLTFFRQMSRIIKIKDENDILEQF